MMAIQRNITLTTMKKCFKAVYGTPIHSYVKDYRIHAAADLLRQTGLSIAEISEKVGYSNQSKFTESFKQRMGGTPLAYRNLNPEGGKSGLFGLTVRAGPVVR